MACQPPLSRLKPHHLAWLSAHPERTADWLAAKLAEGFDVHHMDGDRANNEPDNLVLLDHIDHMRLHGMPRSDRLRRIGLASCSPTKPRARRRQPRRPPAQDPPKVRPPDTWETLEGMEGRDPQAPPGFYYP